MLAELLDATRYGMLAPARIAEAVGSTLNAAIRRDSSGPTVIAAFEKAACRPPQHLALFELSTHLRGHFALGGSARSAGSHIDPHGVAGVHQHVAPRPHTRT